MDVVLEHVVVDVRVVATVAAVVDADVLLNQDIVDAVVLAPVADAFHAVEAAA